MTAATAATAMERALSAHELEAILEEARQPHATALESLRHAHRVTQALRRLRGQVIAPGLPSVRAGQHEATAVIQRYYANYAALELALAVYGEATNSTWQLRTARSGHSREMRALRDDQKLGAARAPRIRLLALDTHQADYVGTGAGEGFILHTTTVCKCGLSKTHCLGCVVQVDQVAWLPVASSGSRAPRYTRRTAKAAPYGKRVSATASTQIEPQYATAPAQRARAGNSVSHLTMSGEQTVNFFLS